LEDVYIAALASLLDATALIERQRIPSRWRRHSPWPRGNLQAQAPLVAGVQRDDTLAPYRKVLASKRIGSLAFLPLALQSGAFGKFLLYYETLLR
jgi:hypothetical protein